MSLQLFPDRVELAVGVSRYFMASGGIAPYFYRLVSGPGGINPTTGQYFAPNSLPEGKDSVAVIEVADSLGVTAQAEAFIGTALMLLGWIIQRELGLQDGRVYLWDQKINAPTDNGLFVALSALNPKCYANLNHFNPATNAQEQQSSWVTQVDVDIISKGPEARDRKEEVVMALNSQYAVQQQDLNSFSIGILPTAIRNLSGIDGAAIPYRFNFSVNLMYTVTKKQSAEYFDTFETPTLLVDP